VLVEIWRPPEREETVKQQSEGEMQRAACY
jgi:hypothetical protein